MASPPFDELVHRINNLLGTIQVQAELARATGTLEAHVNALRLIELSAAHTHECVLRLRNAVTRTTTES